MSYDSDSNYSPGDIARFIALLVAGVVVISVFCIFIIDIIYDANTVDNGDGMGVPMGLADADTDTELTFIQTAEGVSISGGYTGLVRASDIVLVLADNQSVYVRDGQFRYYDGTDDSVITSLVLTIRNQEINGSGYQWAYYPVSDGPYRAYDKSVAHDIDQRVAGFGSHDGDVVISMNNDVTSDNTGSDVVVIITRSADGIKDIKYRWENEE